MVCEVSNRTVAFICIIKGVREMASSLLSSRREMGHNMSQLHETIGESNSEVMQKRLSLFSTQCNKYTPHWTKHNGTHPNRKRGLSARPGRMKFNTNRLYYAYTQKFLYCSIPKTGCTFWKRIMLALNGRYTNKTINPFRMERKDVHHSAQFGRPEKGVSVDLYYRFMFVREPYSRLWSAYVDKFLLPDFWSHGSQIMSTLNINKRNRKEKCQGVDISFEQFLNYVVKSRNNDHWRPMSTLCDPCVFKPEFLGRMETFMPDVTTLAAKFGFSSLLNDYRGHGLEEIRANIGLMFRLFRDRRLNDCASMIDILRRLWVSFQYNGHISTHAQFPEDELKNVTYRLTPNYVFNIFKARRDALPLSMDEKLEQRKESMATAFKLVPLETKKAIASIYKRDFELFGYNPYPNSVFISNITS